MNFSLDDKRFGIAGLGSTKAHGMTPSIAAGLTPTWLPPSLAPRGLSRTEAATYLAVSPSLLDASTAHHQGTPDA